MHDGDLAPAAPAVLPGRRALSTVLAIVMVAMLGVLLFEVLIEGWLVVILGTRRTTSSGNVVVDLATWPKNVKNGLYIGLLAVTALRLTVERRWSELRTRADIALAVLGLIMLVAGLVAGSSAVLIGQALFVYLRGVIVFYAWRALDPPWSVVRRFFSVFGAIIALYTAIAVWQMIVGYPTYRMLGWVDLTWARINRAHALMTHPNDLGHVAGLLLLGLTAWFVASRRVAVRWWILFVVVAAGLGATQSRESVLGVLLGTAVIAFLRRGRYRRAAAAAGLVLVMAAMPLVVSPGNRAEWARRLGGVVSAFEVPSGSEADIKDERPADQDIKCDQASADCASTEVPPREIRVLYMQQGFRLWLHRPVLGYGIGQFGGIVAYRDDPNWNMDPRFGPHGFDKHGFNAKTVDSFWLHLLVETGTLGMIAYLGWIFLLALPFLRVARRARGEEQGVARPVVYWAPAALCFGALIAIFAPSLEDPLFPPLMFSIVGIAWLTLRQGRGGLTDDPPSSPAVPEQAPSGGSAERTSAGIQ